MNTHEAGRRTLSVAACALASLALTIGTALAAVPSTTAHHFSSHPMISGTVVTVNDHQMVVNTDQGEQVTLEVDSRTMAPRDLEPGMVMRAEFLALEDCRFYAQRIMPLRGDMSPGRMQAYANTRDSREMMAGTMTSSGDGRMAHTVDHGMAGSAATAPQAMEEHSPGALMTATPITADHQFSSRPMVSGRVLSVNDHQLMVETDQGQKLGLVMDSRTMVPRDVAPGTIVRTEFAHMKDGRVYAKRVSLIGNGVVAREQAYAHTRDGDWVVARNPSDCGFGTATPGDQAMSMMDRRGMHQTTDLVVAQSEPVPAARPMDVLPQTAGSRPRVLVFGLLALGLAGLLALERGLRTAMTGLRID